ncbi:MAG: hypothetical protein R3E68_13865 [Burkholderiaceae bacterium]
MGAGQATKLVNQTLVLPTYCPMAEAFRLAQAYGVEALADLHRRWNSDTPAPTCCRCCFSG